MYQRYLQIIRRFIILVIACFLFTPVVFSQTVFHQENINPFNEPWRWNNFPEIESDGVRCMTQAKNGNFLFGSNHGVLSYDGISWKYIDSTFSDKTVNNLFLDYKQDIYAATDNGFFHHSAKGWNKIFPKKFISKISKFYKVGVIRELSDGSLLISTGQTFYSGLIHLKKGKITFYSSKKTIESLKKHNLGWQFKTVSKELINDKGFYVEDFFMDTDKTIWGVAAPENKHIKIFRLKYDPGSASFTTLAVYTQNDGIHNAYRNKISRIGKEIWVINGVHDVGINTFNGKRWNYIEPDKTVCDDFLHTSILKTKDGTIWIGGLGVIYSISNGKWKSYKNPEFALPNARVELFEDSKGYLWILAKQKALFRIDYSSNEWKTYKNLNFQCQTKDGIKYFLSFEGRVVINNKGKWSSLGPENGLPSQPVKVFLTRNKQLWVVGSHNQTAAIANYNGKKWTMNLYPNLSWGIDYRSAFEDKSGNIWFGAAVDIRTEKGEKAGLLCYQLHNGSYKVVHYPAVNSTAMYNAYGIGQSKDGLIWVGGSHLASFDGRQWKRYYKPVEMFQYQEYISTLPEGKMWIGSRYYGAFSFDGSKWKNYSIENGLNSNAIICILPVNDKNIWVATDKGFSRYDGLNWANSVFSTQMTFTREGGELFLDLNGSLWINKSMREWKRSTLSHKPLDNHVKQNFFSYNYQPDHSLPETTIITKPYTFSYLSSIVMDWSGKDYFNTTPTERLSYSYRLNNGEWSPFMEKSYFNYYGLEDGNYTFEVRSRDLDFNIDNTPAKIEFVVSAPIWKQAWFILLIILFVVIILVYQKRIHNRNFQLSRLNQKLALSKDKLEVQKEQIVEQNQREMEGMNARMRFFTNISHEFRTPLTLITGNISRILQQSNQEFNASTKEDLNTIERNSNRLLKLINQLMDFRKLESGQMPLRQTQGNVIAFLEELYFSFKLFAETQHIELLFEKKAEKIEAWFDEDKLEKIFINLISNAIKFSPEGGKVKISIELEGTHYKIQVLDTGIGIDPSESEKIFEPFHQASSGITFSNQGTGIGLSFVKNLVELHGGSIKVILLQSESDIANENYKTCFEVVLPVQSDSLQKEENHNPQSEKSLIPSQTLSDNISEIPNSEPSKSGNEKYKPSVLFVDDNEELRQFVYQSLHDDFIITLASDGKKGLEKALEVLPDLIISDVMMPEMNGIDLCKAIKNDELINHIPVILLTSRSTEEHYLDGYKSGADDYLLKPFSITLLKARIWNLIEIRKTLKEQFSKNLLQLPSIKIESKVDSEFLKKVMAVIEANMSEPDFNVDILSAKMGLSSRHLLNKIQALTEFKPVELIQKMRLKRASELLTEQQLTISEVAYEVGFSSPSYFSKCFQKQYQTSPTEFVNSLKS